jgi:hypothetical protein
MSTIDFEAINHKIDILALLGLQGKKADATTNGGEWKTACPWCGGENRCQIWPKHKNGARGWCRQCNRSFDALDVYKYLHNIDTKTAVQELGDKPVIVEPPGPCLSNEKFNLDRWNTTAAELCEQWHWDLWKPENHAALQWLIKRGLNEQGIIANNIGFNDHDHYMDGPTWGMNEKNKVFIPIGITIPNPGHYVNVRCSKLSNSKAKYHKIAGSRGFLYVAGLNYDHSIGFLFESELDAILISQCSYAAAYFSLPAGQNLKPEYSHYLEKIEQLIICMDNDEEGKKAAKKHLEIKNTIEGDYIPDCKDLGELFQKSGMDAVINYLLDMADRIEGKAWTLQT